MTYLEFGTTQVTSVACGASHTLFLCHDGSVYGCGDATDGQLPCSKHELTSPPTRHGHTALWTLSRVLSPPFIQCSGHIQLALRSQEGLNMIWHCTVHCRRDDDATTSYADVVASGTPGRTPFVAAGQLRPPTHPSSRPAGAPPQLIAPVPRRLRLTTLNPRVGMVGTDGLNTCRLVFRCWPQNKRCQ